MDYIVHLSDSEEQFIEDTVLSKRSLKTFPVVCSSSFFISPTREERRGRSRRGEGEYISNRRLWEDGAAGRLVRRTTVDFTTVSSLATTRVFCLNRAEAAAQISQRRSMFQQRFAPTVRWRVQLPGEKYGWRGDDNARRVRASFFGFPAEVSRNRKEADRVQLDAHTFVTFPEYLQHLREIFVQIASLCIFQGREPRRERKWFFRLVDMFWTTMRWALICVSNTR